MKKYKLGLALSGGGARGLAHLGFLKVLEREKIKVDFLSGTSMGSVIAASYARGMDLDEMEEVITHATTMRNIIRMVNLTPPGRGLFELNKVKSVLAQLIPESVTFRDLNIPLAICATDLIQSTAITLSEGEVLPAVMASCAVPGVFPPVYKPPYKLVDGGVLNNLPVDLVQSLGAEKIIAIDVQVNPFDNVPWEDHPFVERIPIPLPSSLKDIIWSATMMIAQITQVQIQIIKPDVYIRPNIPREISLFTGFHKAREVIAYGVSAAEEHLPEIRRMMEE
jgi:NTE family protein